MAIDTRYGAFVPTTESFEIEDLDSIDINSPEFKDFLVRLRQILNNSAMILNIKDTGIYDPEEFVCGQIWFPDPALTSYTARKPTERQVLRKVINFGALPNAGTKNVAHGITFPAPNTYSFTRVYGAATDPTGGSYLPLPFAAITDNNNIELSVDNTNVIVTTGINRAAWTTSYVVLEYIKD